MDRVPPPVHNELHEYPFFTLHTVYFTFLGSRGAHRGGHWTALASQVRMRQSSPSSGLVQAPVAHLQPLNSPSHTTAYAYLYLSDVGHTCRTTFQSR